MANNPILFNAVLAGVFGAINTSRALTSAVDADYMPQVDNAVNFATLVDAEIPIDVYLPAEAVLLCSIVQEIVSGKGSAGLNATSVNAIVAAWQAARTGIDAGGSTSDTGIPLDLARFVWGDTLVPADQQNGTVGAPFSTGQAAYDSFEGNTGTMLVAPTITALGPLETTVPLGIRGLGADGDATLSYYDGDITAAADLSITNMYVDGFVTVDGGTLTLVGSNVQAILSNSYVNAINCHAVGGEADTIDIFNCPNIKAIEANTNIGIRSSLVSSDTELGSFGDLSMTDCTGDFVLPISVTGQCTLRNCLLENGEYTIGGNCIINNCRLSGAIFNITGDLVIDSASYRFASIHGVTFNLVGLIEFSDPPIRAEVPVTIPVLAAGVKGSASASLVGTPLEGLTPTGTIITANPIIPCGLINAAISADNTLTCEFTGATAGGPVDINVAIVS